jgi:methyl-accepting chemotaxis protein
MQKDGVFTGETVVDPDGLNLPVMYTGAPIKDAGGQIIGALQYLVDIAIVQNTEIVKSAQRVADKIAVYQYDEVEKVSAALQKVAGGDLTVQYQVGEADEDTAEVYRSFTAIADAINATLRNLSAMIGQITESANQFAEGSRLVSETAQTVASGAQEQSSSVEEVTASMEGLTHSVERVEGNAGEADQAAKQTTALAEQGGGNRQPDQPAGPERGHRGRPGRRTRPGIRRRSRRGPQTGRTRQPGRR